MSKKSARLTRFAGLGLAGMGLSHFTSPMLWDPITKPAFPRRTRQHVYTNGGIETALGLGLVGRNTRNLAIVGGIGYLAYLGGNAIRSAR
jgi:uncharacterized membrane protein